jgi:ADP-ribosylglycohydrolase
MTKEERAIGCMIGSAYGDSLGAAVEFLHYDEIQRQFGDKGITELESVYGAVGNITDDTQMALATAEGLLAARSDVRNLDKTIKSIWLAYRDWYDTQHDYKERRAPGNTCLSALGSGAMGTLHKPLNRSAGCGAIMRAHPIGISFASQSDAFQVGIESGIATHGHPNGYIPAGFLSVLITKLMDGDDFGSSVEYVATGAAKYPNGAGKGTAGVVERAWKALDMDIPAHEVIDRYIGGTGGWLGHDALAIGLYAVGKSLDDPMQAMEISVNHSGDSDSTGTIAGAILGTIHGPSAFQEALTQQSVQLEHAGKLQELGSQLAEQRGY